MPFFLLDDQFHLHPKVTRLLDDHGAAGVAAIGLYGLVGSYSQARLSDGLVSPGDVRRLLGDPRRVKQLTGLLVDVGLFDTEDDGWRIHDFAKTHRQTGDGVRVSREKRSELKRPGLLAAVAGRDENKCRYCGAQTSPPDRKSKLGRTFDHVDPNRAEGARNLVVACRGCNGKKGQRTPEEAGMPLLPVPARSSQIKSGSVHTEQIRTDLESGGRSAEVSRARGRARGLGIGLGKDLVSGEGEPDGQPEGEPLQWDAGAVPDVMVAAPSGSPWHGHRGPPPPGDVMDATTCPSHNLPQPCWRCEGEALPEGSS